MGQNTDLWFRTLHLHRGEPRKLPDADDLAGRFGLDILLESLSEMGLSATRLRPHSGATIKTSLGPWPNVSGA